jgi:hypothetical protein
LPTTGITVARIAGHYLYVADGDEQAQRLSVIDIHDPSDPVLVGQCDWVVVSFSSEQPCNLAVADGYAYVADWSGGLVVIDVREPTRPVCYYSEVTAQMSTYDVQVAGSNAYVLRSPFHESRSVLSVLNVADPVNPQALADWEQPGLGLAGIRVQGQYLYVGGTGAAAGLQVLDISDPGNPVRVGGYDIPYEPGHVYATLAHVSGSRAYVTLESNDGMTHELNVLDVSDPRNPMLVSTYPSESQIGGVRAWGDYVLVAEASRLRVLEVRPPASPTVVGNCDLPCGSWFRDAMDVSGSTVCVDCGGSVAIFEIGLQLTLNMPVLSGNTLTLSWNGGPGIKLQKTTTLTNPNWLDVAGSDGVSQIDVLCAGSAGFFRLVKP